MTVNSASKDLLSSSQYYILTAKFLPGIHEPLFQIQSCSDNHSSKAFIQLTDSAEIQEPNCEEIFLLLSRNAVLY